MNRHWIILLVICHCAGLRARAQQTWELKKDENGIKVYTRGSDSSRCDDLKVETILPGKLSSLAALVLDVGNYPNWSFNNEKAYVLKKINQTDLYFYSLVNAPWPANDRDLIVHLRVRQDSSTRKLYISADEMANYIPEKKGIVRIPLSVERWIVTPLAGDKLKISYELRLDPGASAPAWLINLLSTRGPYQTFLNLRDQLQKPRYHDATLPFIKN